MTLKLVVAKEPNRLGDNGPGNSELPPPKSLAGMKFKTLTFCSDRSIPHSTTAGLTSVIRPWVLSFYSEYLRVELKTEVKLTAHGRITSMNSIGIRLSGPL